MNAIQEPERGCPSRLRFDRLLAGELEPSRAAALTAHAAGCARCGGLLVELRHAHGAFAHGAVLPGAVVRRVRERRRSIAWARWGAPALAAAAALLAWSAWPRLRPDAPRFGERSKGGAVELAFYVLHDGAVRLGADGERVQPGDRIELAYTSDHDAYLAVLSIDAARKASTYYAKDGRAAKIPAARRAVLDQSTLLDATLGRELVYILICAEPIAVAPLLQALERAPEATPVATSCTIERRALFKVPR